MEEIISKYRKEKVIDSLEFFTLLYMGIPLVLFFLSWFKWYYAIILIIFTIIPVLSYQIKFNSFKFRNHIKDIIIYIIYVIFLVLIGNGEFIPQSGDWLKHNAIFSELYNHWNQPVNIEYKGNQYFLCYGLGFYMVPSWIAGFFKCHFLLRWLVLFNTAFGLFLIGHWIKRIWNLSVWCVLAIFFIDRLDWVIDFKWLLENYSDNSVIFNKLISFNTFDIIDQIPQHSIPIILAALCCIFQLKKSNINLVFLSHLGVVGIFWSPFFAFALFPFSLLVFYRYVKTEGKFVLIRFLPILLIFIVLAHYYSLHLKVDNFVFNWKSLKHFIYVLFTKFIPNYILPFVFILILNVKCKLLTSKDFIIICWPIIFTFLFTQFDFGYLNDFEDKTTFITTIVLNIYILYLAKATFFYKPYRIVLLVIIVSGIFMPAKMLLSKYYAYKNLERIQFYHYNNQLLAKEKKISLTQSLNYGSELFNYPFIMQYLGKEDELYVLILKSK